MISTYESFLLSDEAKENDFQAEVNWDAHDSKSNHSQLVRFTFPDGKIALVKRELLNTLLFVIGKPEDQRKMIPQKLQPVHHFEQKLEVTVKQDIPKGGKIVFKHNGSIPCLLTKEFLGDAEFNKEVQKEMAKKKTKKIFMS